MEKKWYSVQISSDDFIFGYVKLTKEEADLIGYNTNPDNWKALDSTGPWHGCFTILPATEEEIKENHLDEE